MNNNETRTLWLSVAAALFAVFLLYSYTNSRNKEIADNYAIQRTVVIASKDINEMNTIDETMLTTEARPVKYIQPTALTNAADAVGWVALAPIKAGEEILQNKIMQPGPVTGLSFQVAPNKRAVSLPIDEIHGVSKLIKPGDRIDIIAAVDVGRGPNLHKEVKTVLQNVVILATGQKIVNELPRLMEQVGNDPFIRNIRADSTFSTITVEASPQEAQSLIYILATSPGSLFVTLRHPSDKINSVLTEATVESVLNRVDTSTVSEAVRAPASASLLAQPGQGVKPQAPQQTAKPKKKKGGFVDL